MKCGVWKYLWDEGGRGGGEGGMGLVFVSFLLVWFIFEWGRGARVSFFVSFV
jgi:hypothetical protein